MYKIVDQFTSRDGHLYPDGDNQEFGISKEMMEKYGGEIKDKGCATCFFVKLDGGPATEVLYFTTAGYTEEQPVGSDRWAHISMFNPGSGYDDSKLTGPWGAHAVDASSDVVTGVGLPRGWHITTYVVMVWDDNALPDGGDNTGEGPDVPDEPEGLDKYPIYVTWEFGGDTYEGYVRKVT